MSRGENRKRKRGRDNNDVIGMENPRLNPFIRGEPKLYSLPTLIIHRRSI